jgi:hypothetical protein
MSETTTMISAIEIQEKTFELAQRRAKVYASSSLVPKEYQNNIANVIIATNMAERMEADPLMVMQNLYIVHGKPGWSAQFLIACFNSCGRFSAIKYRLDGDGDDYGCVAYATELESGERVEGVRVTLGMAKAEGWSTKAGSKWKTMPDLMLRYRAATFLVRCTAPEIGLGLQTSDEVDDTLNGRVTSRRTESVGVDDLARLVDAKPIVDYRARLNTAVSAASLLELEAEIEASDMPDKAELLGEVSDRLAAIEAESAA